MRTLIALALLAVLATLARAGELAPAAKTEIDALMSRLATSECQFNRNGSWYTGAKAKDHLQTKLDYLVKKDGITTAEEFIEMVATKSISSGRTYKMRCPNQAERPCALWLADELHQIREAHSKLTP